MVPQDKEIVFLADLDGDKKVCAISAGSVKSSGKKRIEESDTTLWVV
jgi:hypothetical protein